MAKQDRISFLDFKKRFSSEEACREYLYNMRWSKGFICPKCGHKICYAITTRHLYECTACHYQAYPVVKRIMAEEGLKSVHCRRRQRSLTDSRKARSDEYKNLTKDLEITYPFQVLSSDISYIRTGEGFDYLCQVRDILTNTVLASCQSETMKAALVSQTIKMAQKRWQLPAGIILHSDRGSQYTAKDVIEQVTGYGWQQSFSRVGKPGDNSWSESFFAILKKEIIHWHFYPTREQARQAIFEHIEVFYNRQRAQKQLGYLSPIQYLKQWQQNQLQTVA